jgi:hypothetical protein
LTPHAAISTSKRALFGRPLVAGRTRALRVAFAGALVAVAFAQRTAQAGHESPFYPSFYPQEIRIETIDPATAAAGWPKARVHAYVGGDAFAGGTAPADAAPVESLHTFVVLTFDPSAGRNAALASDPQNRCAAAGRILRTLAPGGAGFVRHPYPVTPYHADYLEQFDLARRAQARYSGQAPGVTKPAFKIRAKGQLAETLIPADWRANASEWDATLEEIDLGPLAATETGLGVGPPWSKQGWYQAHLLYNGILSGGAAAASSEAAYRKLVSGDYRSPTERINLERALVSTLVAGCERVIVGYTLRREYFNAEYSSGVENIAFDSQSGFLSRIFPRSVKLKDFPWNGWLRLGTPAKPIAAWNPIGGFSDPFGRMLWLTMSDPALLPAPYGGSWVANRVSIAPTSRTGAAAIPNDAVRPEAGTGRLRPISAGKTARQLLRYSVVTSAFHDGTKTGVADILYPYIFAFRWSAEHSGNGIAFDPAIARSTALMREWLVGFKVVGVKTQTRNFGSDLKFSYRVPLVDVYLDRSSGDPWEAAAVAPPWSTLPWEVIVLMEEAVQRGIAAFSPGEAQRRGVPWLDLVRDPMTGARLAALVDEFRLQAYRPAVLKEMVTANEARERWTALRAFYTKYGHFLVTNGPYRLDSWSADGVVLQVFRDLSYPQGVGSFDEYAIPRKAFASKIEDRGDRIEIQADVERVSRFQRSYEIARVALGADASHADAHERPECRYVIVGPDGNVVRAGAAPFSSAGRFVLDLHPLPGPGAYAVMIALFAAENRMNPDVKVIEHRVTGALAPRQAPRPRLNMPPASR